MPRWPGVPAALPDRVRRARRRPKPGARARAFGLLACALVAGGCRASSLDLDVILPRAGDELLGEVACYRLVGARGADVRRATATDPFRLHLDSLTPGTYALTLEAVENPLDDSCNGGDVRARAATDGVRLEPGRQERVPLLLLPFDRPVALDLPASVEDWFEGRTEMAAAVAVDGAGVPRVIFAGGRTADGKPSAEVTVYEPRRARFSALPDMQCARAGAVAIAMGAPGEAEQVVVAGGDGDCTERLCEEGFGGSDASCSGEVLEPTGGRSAQTQLAVPVARPRAVRDGGAVWLLGSSTDEAIVQSYSGNDWARDIRQDMNLPLTGGAFTPVLADGSPPFLVAGGRGADGLMRTISLLRPQEDRLVPCAITETTAPVAGDDVVAAPTRNGRVLFAGNESDGGAGWLEQRFDETGCAPIPEVTIGTLASPRSAPLATVLAGGRVLLSGGDADGSLELFLPYERGTLPLGAGSGPRHGQVAVALEDGSVLVAGGGPRGVDAVLPRPSEAGRTLHWDHVAEPEPAVDILIVASSHAEAHDVRQMLIHGGTFRRPGDGGALEGGFVPGGDPAGLTAAISPFAGFEFAGVKNFRILITTGDVRCDEHNVGDGGRPSVCSDPDVTDPDLEIECALAEIDETDRCIAQELLSAVQTATVDETFAAPGGRPLLVLIAGARDDCSSATGEVFVPGATPLVERCASAPDLLDPVAFAETLAHLRGGDPALISVMTFGGPEEGAPDVEACPGIYPTPRLAALSRAMGERGMHVDLCDRGPANPPLASWSQLVEGRIGRRVCLPYRPATPASCLVTYERDVAPGERERVRVPAGDEGWTVIDSSCDYGSLMVSPRLELPIGKDVFYACQ